MLRMYSMSLRGSESLSLVERGKLIADLWEIVDINLKKK